MCVYGLVLPALVPPAQWVLKVPITDTNAQRAGNGIQRASSHAAHVKADKFSAKGDFSSSVLIVISK